MSLTRHEFEEGIQLWLEQQDGRAATSAWTVKEQVRSQRLAPVCNTLLILTLRAQPCTSHQYLQSLGRPVLLRRDEQCQPEGVDLLSEEEADEAAAPCVASTTHKITGSVDTYVVWSPVYQVPALLFRGYDCGPWRAVGQPICSSS